MLYATKDRNADDMGSKIINKQFNFRVYYETNIIKTFKF